MAELPSFNLNSVIEDTSVLVAGAFLLVRSRVGKFTVSKPLLGAIFGLVAFTEILAPDARFPYAMHTLACFVAAVYGSMEALIGALALAGLLAVIAMSAGRTDAGLPFLVQIAVVGVCCFTMIRIGLLNRLGVWKSALAMAATQGFAVWIGYPLVAIGHAAMSSLISVPANSLGMILIALVVTDAQSREEADRLRLEATESKRIAAEAQLSSLRSRVQPHFLLNALNTIAALCDIAPARAAKATVGLGEMLRRLLEMDPNAVAPLSEEMKALQGYLRIEEERFGDRIAFFTLLDPTVDPKIPPFSLQILVENAILHGLTPRPERGSLVIMSRETRRGAVVAVSDNGIGIRQSPALESTAHGLGILNAQLVTIYGPSARLRLFSQPGKGTMAVFLIPNKP